MRALLLAGLCSCLPVAAQDHRHAEPTGSSPSASGAAREHDEHGEPAHSAPSDGAKDRSARLVHRALPDLPAEAALHFLRESNARATAAHARGEPPPPAVERPAGAGRYVVAVIGCADAGIDTASLFGLEPEDVLWIAGAGASVTSDSADLVAWAAREHRVRLCLVLAHDHCASLGTNDDRKVAAKVAGADRRAAPARALADRRRITVADAQALLQAEQLRAALRSSAPAPATPKPEPSREGLRPSTPGEDVVRVVAASLDPSTRKVTFLVPRADEMPIAPVR